MAILRECPSQYSIRKRTPATSTSEQPAKQRKVKHETYQKWVRKHNRECQTVMWLDCEMGIKGAACETCHEAGVSSVRIFDGKSNKVENGRTKLFVLSQIVHTIFISHFIHCQAATSIHQPNF